MSSRTGRRRVSQASSTPPSGRLVANSSRPVDIGPSLSFDSGGEGLPLTTVPPRKAADAGFTVRRTPRRRLPTSGTASCNLSPCAGHSSTASSGTFRSGARWLSVSTAGEHPVPIPSACTCRPCTKRAELPATRVRLHASSLPTAYRSSFLSAGLTRTSGLYSSSEAPLSGGRSNPAVDGEGGEAEEVASVRISLRVARSPAELRGKCAGSRDSWVGSSYSEANAPRRSSRLRRPPGASPGRWWGCGT